MKYNLFVFLLLIISSFSVSSQNYSFVRTIEDETTLLVPGKHGTFYSLAWIPGCPSDYVKIRFFNAKGEVLHAFQSPLFTGSFTSIQGVANQANHLVLYLRLETINHLLYEIDSTGTVVRNNNLQYVNPVVKFSRLVEGPSGYFLLGNTATTTWADSSHAILASISATGAHRWTRFYRRDASSPASTSFHDLIRVGESLVAVGRYYLTNDYLGQAPYRPLLAVLDTLGSPIETYYYMVDSGFIGFDEYEFVQIDASLGGKFFLVGNNFGNEHALFCLDETFNIRWIREKLSGRSSAFCAGYREDVFISPEGAFGNFAMQFDSTGQVVSTHGIGNPTGGYDFSYGRLKALFRHGCGFLMANDENLIAHTDPTFLTCLDSSVADYIPYYSVSNFYRRPTGLASGYLNNPYDYLMVTEFSPFSATATAHCVEEYTCPAVQSIPAERPLGVRLFPNPASHRFQVEWDAESILSDIRLFDIRGKLIWRADRISGFEMDISVEGMADGVYFLELRTPKGLETRKICVFRP